MPRFQALANRAGSSGRCASATRLACVVQSPDGQSEPFVSSGRSGPSSWSTATDARPRPTSRSDTVSHGTSGSSSAASSAVPPGPRLRPAPGPAAPGRCGRPGSAPRRRRPAPAGHVGLQQPGQPSCTVRFVPQRNPAQHDEAVAQAPLRRRRRRPAPGSPAASPHRPARGPPGPRPTSPAPSPLTQAACRPASPRPGYSQCRNRGKCDRSGPRTRCRSDSTASREGRPPKSVTPATTRRMPATNSAASSRSSA